MSTDETIWENQDAIIRWFNGYRSWYCKKTQPNNYIRITCRKDPANSNNPYFWICGIQVFGKGNKLIDNIRINADAYRNFPMSPGWGPLITAQGGNYEYRIYRNPEVRTDDPR